MYLSFYNVCLELIFWKVDFHFNGTPCVMSVRCTRTTANFIRIANVLDVMCQPEYTCLTQIICTLVPRFF